MQKKGYKMKSTQITPSVHTAQAEPSTRTVNTVVMHREFHLDECGAYWLAKQAGTHVFVGIGNAQIVFSENCPDTPVAVWKARQQLAIGTGGDIDEHKSGNNSRIASECSATLMRKAIGGALLHDKCIKRMVDEILRFDEATGCPKGHLAEFIKVGHRCMNGADPLLLRWSSSALTAVYQRLTLNHSPASGERSFAEHAEVEFREKAGAYTDAKAVAYVVKALKEAEALAEEARREGREELVFSLDFVYKSFLRVQGLQEARENILFILDKMYVDQVAFQTLRAEANKTARRFWVKALLDGTETSLCMMMMHTEDPRAGKVLATLGAKIMVVINDGRPVILKDNRISGLSLNHCRGMLRWLELPAKQKHAVAFDELAKTEGVHRLVPQWYGCPYMVANGTTTHTGLPKTHIVDAAVREVVEHAFHPRLIAHWKRLCGIDAGNKPQGGGKKDQLAKKPTAPKAKTSASEAPVVPALVPTTSPVHTNGDGSVSVTNTIGEKLASAAGGGEVIAIEEPLPEEKKVVVA